MKLYEDSNGLWHVGARTVSTGKNQIVDDGNGNIRIILSDGTTISGNISNITDGSNVAYTSVNDLLGKISGFFVNASLGLGGLLGTLFFIDGQSTDASTETGSINHPFKTFGNAVAAMTDLTKSYALYLTPATYTEVNACVIPAVSSFSIHGNKSTLICPTITINSPYSIYDLVTNGDVIYAYTGATRSSRIGGSLVGNVSISGFEDYESVNFSAHTVTVQANANPLFSHCTLGSKLVSADPTTTITINDCSFSRPTVDDYNIDMSAGGVLVCKGALLNNKSYTSGGTHANINLSGASTSSSNPSLLSGCICSNGIVAGTAYIIYGDDNLVPVISGSKIVPIKSPVVPFGIGGGTAQVQTATVPMIAFGYIAGMEFYYTPSVANSATAPTLNVNGYGAKVVKRGIYSSSDAIIGTYDMPIGKMLHIIYDGTCLRLMNPASIV